MYRKEPCTPALGSLRAVDMLAIADQLSDTGSYLSTLDREEKLPARPPTAYTQSPT